MRLTTFKVPDHHFSETQHCLRFRHHWRGQDMYWIVPMVYVVMYDFKQGEWHIRISEAYFNVSVNALAA